MGSDTIKTVYTVKDLSEYFKKHPRTIRRWIDEGKFPSAQKVGRFFYVEEGDLSRKTYQK